VTVPGPFTVIIAEQLKVLGQDPVKFTGSTPAVTPDTAKAAVAGGGVYASDDTVT